MPTPDDADDLAEIIKRNEEVSELALEYEEKNETAKNAKGKLEAALADLNRFIKDLATDRLLFRRQPATAAEAAAYAEADTPAGPRTPPPADPDAWRRVPVTELVAYGLSPKIVESLTEHGIELLGQLAEWTAHHSLTDVPGVGDVKAAKIEDALAAYWAANPQPAPPADGEPVDAEFVMLALPSPAGAEADPDEALADDTLFALLTVGHAKDAALDAMEAALLTRGKPFDSAAEWVDAVYERGIVSVDARVAAAEAKAARKARKPKGRTEARP